MTAPGTTAGARTSLGPTTGPNCTILAHLCIPRKHLNDTSRRFTTAATCDTLTCCRSGAAGLAPGWGHKSFQEWAAALAGEQFARIIWCCLRRGTHRLRRQNWLGNLNLDTLFLIPRAAIAGRD